MVIRGETLKVAREHITYILILGILGVGVYNIIWKYGIHKTTAANAALLISTSPIFTGIYSFLKGDEKLSLSKCLGTLTA